MLDLSTIASLFEHYVDYMGTFTVMYLVIKAQILYCSPYLIKDIGLPEWTFHDDFKLA